VDAGRVVLSLLCLAVSVVDPTSEKSLIKSSHDVAPRDPFKNTLDRVYKLADGPFSSPPINFQEIALVFIIMAQGTMYNIEMPNYDSSAEDWLHLSEQALVKGDFLSNNMVPGLQTLVSFEITIRVQSH
jgi:hypothetical protein